MPLKLSPLVLLLLVIACGCEGPARNPSIYDAFWAAGKIDLAPPKGTRMKPTTRGAESNEALEMMRKRYELESDIEKRTNLRNEIADNIKVRIEHYHEGVTDDLYELTAKGETLFDVLGLVLGGLGAATGGLNEKAAYSAASGALTGFRSSLSNNILAKRTEMALRTQMEADVTQKKAEIQKRLNTTTAKEYPLSMVLDDLYGYYKAGSLKNAVRALDKAAHDNSNKAQTDLEAAKTLRVSAPAPAPQ